MKAHSYLTKAGLTLCLLLMVGCNEAAQPTPTRAATPAAIAPTASATSEPSPTPIPTQPTATLPAAPTSTASPTATPPPTATSMPTATPDPYRGLSIAELAGRSYGGGQLDIIDTLESNDSFTRYLITYPSDGLTIYGYMNVPNEGYSFPVALVLHGYISPDEYQTVAYTERYANALAEAGYFVIHPNFRNYPPSDSGPDPYRTGYAIDILNLIAIIREQSQDPSGYLRRADADNIHLWGHSMGGGVTLRVITVNNEPYIRAAVLYGSMSGDEVLNYRRIQEWSDGNRGEFELAAPEETLQAISPIYHLERILAPISIHHSSADATVPPEWSDDLCTQLQALAHPVECFTYNGLPHTFNGAGDRLFIKRVIAFFDRY